MSEKLQKILQEIDDGLRKDLYNIEFSVIELLSKDSGGKTFLESLFERNIELPYSMRDSIENNIEIAYIYCKYNKLIYFFDLNEDDLFSVINGQTYLEYFIEKDKINTSMIKSIKNHFEIIDIIINSKYSWMVDSLNPEIINKLMLKNQDGIYGIEKYINNEQVFDKLISLVSEPNILLKICQKYNNNEWLKKSNESVLMRTLDNDITLLDYLINEKKIIPDVLKKIPYNEEFIKFLFDNKLYDYLAMASENVMLFELESGKTLLETLIEMGYESKFSFTIFKEKTLNILKNKNKLELAQYVCDSLVKKKR